MDGPEANKIERTEDECPPPTQPYPWLYFEQSGSTRDQRTLTFCSISDPTKTYSKFIPEFLDGCVMTLQHGCYLFAEHDCKLSIWQPTINLEEKIILPNLQFDPLYHDATCYYLSCSPTATDQVCSLFIFGIYCKMFLYYQLGSDSKEWTEVDYYSHSQALSPDEYLVNPVYCNGCLYAESSIQHLLVVIQEKHDDEGGFEINSTHIFLPRTPSTFNHRTSLVQSNNELFYIQIMFQGHVIISVAVHRLDFSQMVWERVKSIKDRVFFLSQSSSFACETINHAEGGRIYFTLTNNTFVHIYNIEDNSLVRHTFSNLPKLIPDRFFSDWFMPDLRTTFSLQGEREETQIRREEETSVAAHSRDKAANSFEALPFDIIEEVAKCLKVHDYLHFRATNNFFRLRAPPLQWRPLSHTSTSSFDDLSLCPLFVFFEKENVLTFVHPKYGIKYKYNINLPKDIQGDCQILGSKDGWLLLAVDKFSNIFFNPFTREVKELAYGPTFAYGSAPEQKRDTLCVGISHPPTSSECVVVELHRFSYLISDIIGHTTRLGDKYWKTDFENPGCCFSYTSPCLHNGIFYYLSCDGKLATLEEDEGDIFCELCEKLDAPCTDYYNSYLVECNGSLLSVFECAFGKWVRVFKLNESEMIWTEVESLGNYMLFVGKQSFSAVANIPEMENKIYFSRFHDENIVFYSLEKKSYHTFESTKGVDFRVSERFNSSWIQPRGPTLSK